MNRLSRTEFLYRSGMLAFGMILFPGISRAMNAQVFRIPGCEGHVRHGLLTRHANNPYCPKWLNFIQRDRFYKNGHSSSENDLVSYMIEAGDLNFSMMFQTGGDYLLHGDRSQTLHDEHHIRSKGTEFVVIKCNDPTVIKVPEGADEPVLFVLRGNVLANRLPVLEGEGMRLKANEEIKIRPLNGAFLCLGYKN